MVQKIFSCRFNITAARVIVMPLDESLPKKQHHLTRVMFKTIKPGITDKHIELTNAAAATGIIIYSNTEWGLHVRFHMHQLKINDTHSLCSKGREKEKKERAQEAMCTE